MPSLIIRPRYRRNALVHVTRESRPDLQGWETRLAVTVCGKGGEFVGYVEGKPAHERCKKCHAAPPGEQRRQGEPR